MTLDEIKHLYPGLVPPDAEWQPELEGFIRLVRSKIAMYRAEHRKDSIISLGKYMGCRVWLVAQEPTPEQLARDYALLLEQERKAGR